MNMNIKLMLYKLKLFSIPFRLLIAVFKYLQVFKNNLLLQVKFGCMISFKAIIRFEHINDIFIANSVSICANTVIYCTNENNKNGNTSKLIIGENTYIGEMNNIRCAGGKIVIGNKCLISQNVNIIGSNYTLNREEYIMQQTWDDSKTGVVIEDDVWVGCGSTILPGVKIGKGAIVAAGSIVTKNIESYTIVGGNPAKFLRKRV